MSNLFTRPQHKAGSLLRGLSAPLWTPSDLEYVRLGGIDRGFGFIDDFVDESEYADNYVLDTVAVTDTPVVVPLDLKGGGISLDQGGTTADDGLQIQRLADTGYETFVASADADIFFEARLNLSDVGTMASGDGVNFFVGLSERDATLMAAGVNSSANHIGFECLASAGSGLAFSFVSEKAGTRTTHGSTFAFTDGTYIKLGFYVNGVTKIVPYVDGAKKTAVTTNIPVVNMAPVVAHYGEGTVDPICNIDWIACYQFEQISH